MGEPAGATFGRGSIDRVEGEDHADDSDDGVDRRGRASVTGAGRFDSVPERIRREIEKRIVDGGLQPGERLGLKRELQGEFGVAGPTIDQALRLLADDGLVTVRRGPGGGVFVDRSRPVLRLGTKRMWARDTQMYAENREVREALTALLAASSAHGPRRTPDRLERLAQVADEVERAPVEAFETQRRIWEGQHLLLELCDNRTLAALFDDLLTTAADVLVTVDPPTTDREATRERRRVAAHVSLFRAVVDGDPEAASEFGRLVRVLGAPADVAADRH